MREEKMETTTEKLDRLAMMVAGDPKWDLSPNDIEALAFVVNERAALRAENAVLRVGLEAVFECHPAPWEAWKHPEGYSEVLDCDGRYTAAGFDPGGAESVAERVNAAAELVAQ